MLSQREYILLFACVSNQWLKIVLKLHLSSPPIVLPWLFTLWVTWMVDCDLNTYTCSFFMSIKKIKLINSNGWRLAHAF